MIEHTNTPLYSKLCEHAEKEKYSFHVPGHKNGDVFLTQGSYFQPLLQIDSTELTGLDDLHDPQGVIKEAEALTAHFYKAQRTYFLVGGTTVGNLAMILASCKQDDIVLVQRNSHKSIMNGCRLAKVNPVFLSPEIDPTTGLTIGVSLESVQEALHEYPNAKAIILTYPSYYGMTVNIKSIIEYAHALDIPVLVDEAHGAHFILGEPFPTSALELGADIVVHSAHKTLPAMTMASYIHVNHNSRIRPSSIQYYLQMLQSSSPSYPLLASLDLARSYLASLTKERVVNIHKDIIKFKKGLSQIPQWTVIEGKDDLQIDPLKVILQSNCEATGIEIQAKLEAKGIYVELANEDFLLLVMPLAPFDKGNEVVQMTEKALADIPLRTKITYYDRFKLLPYSTLGLSYEEMEQKDKKRVLLDASVGELAAEQVIPYPPGIPFIMEGECVTRDKVDLIKEMQNSGIRFQGHSDIENEGLLVFK